MKKINKNASKILDTLTAGLGPGDGRKVDNANGRYMAVHVNNLGGSLFSVAHYFVQNGDMMADPDVVFFRGDDGSWFPVETTMHALGYFRRFVVLDRHGMPERIDRAGQRDLATFCGTWLQNIKEQQGSLTPPAAPASTVPGPDNEVDEDEAVLARSEALDCIYCGAPSATTRCDACPVGAAASTGPQAPVQLSLF